MANSDINITVRRGTVHALVGEHGAGKSTLMKPLYGMHQPDEGSITVNGTQAGFHSPADAIAVGIGMVHQHFMLADNLTNDGVGYATSGGQVDDIVTDLDKAKQEIIDGTITVPSTTG